MYEGDNYKYDGIVCFDAVKKEMFIMTYNQFYERLKTSQLAEKTKFTLPRKPK